MLNTNTSKRFVMKFKSKYDNRIDALIREQEIKKRQLLQMLATDFERKANQLAPRDEGDLQNSSETEITKNGFNLAYNVNYAVKVYRAVGIKISTAKNPNAMPYWTDEAWNRNKGVYLTKWKNTFK
jgi:hypothetical protein